MGQAFCCERVVTEGRFRDQPGNLRARQAGWRISPPERASRRLDPGITCVAAQASSLCADGIFAVLMKYNSAARLDCSGSLNGGPMYLPLRAISVFHAVARAGSVSKAAAELNVTPSAVSQQIQSLEIHLGTSLMAKMG